VSVALSTEKNIFFYKTSYLNEEHNCTESSPSERVPWGDYTRYKLTQGKNYKTLRYRRVEKKDSGHCKLVGFSKAVENAENNKDTSLLPIKFDNSKL
jgi:hypothetical protein